MPAPDRVAICCPGPSFDPADIPPDFAVAAVNHTLKVVPRCDWWICYDCPHEVHHQCIPALLKFKPTIVTLQERVDCWRVWFRQLQIPEHEWPAFEIADWGPPWLKSALSKGPSYTSTMAVSWALRRRVRHLHYLGADMGGYGYFDQEAMKLKINFGKKGQIWDDRWIKERKLLTIAQREAAKRGHMAITGMPWGDEVAEEMLQAGQRRLV